MKFHFPVRAAIVAASLTAVMAVSAYAYDVQGGTVTTSSAVNFRTEATTSSESMGKLSDGTRVAILDETDGWYKVAYNGKTVDIVHISTTSFDVEAISNGTLIRVGLQELQPHLDNDEGYFIWRMPHKSLDAIFKPCVDVENAMERLRDLITTPVVSEKYGYSIRINESRLLPEEITRIGMFHRQKLSKAVITLSVDEKYELNDSNCYRIRRLEENLYRNYLPKDYQYDDVITYQWNQSRENNLQGQFNFYYSITKNSVSRGSMFLYMILLLAVGVIGDFISEAVQAMIGLFI